MWVDRKSEGDIRDIGKVLRRIFEQSSENDDDEILLILGLTESLPKVFDYKLPMDEDPKVIPTQRQCKKKINLIPPYRYRIK